jgi:HEAT repeat protein
MAKARSSEAKLARLRQLRGEPRSPEQLQELRSHLRDVSNLVAAEAAAITGETQCADLATDLAEAFERFLEDPEKNDKQCRAKIAIVEALYKLDFSDEEFWLRGIHYVQEEPAWPRSHDTAVPVRVGSALALVRNRYRGVLPLLIDMLADENKAARVGAVQALAYSGTEAAGLLLRLKVRLGDAEDEVMAECFGGILELSPAAELSFVAEYLSSPNEAIREAVLLALGNSRQPAAFEILKAFAQKHSGDLQEVAHVALALLRLQVATDFLLTLVAEQPEAVALSALAALAVHRHDPRVHERAAAAVTRNGAGTLLALFAKRFGAIK